MAILKMELKKLRKILIGYTLTFVGYQYSGAMTIQDVSYYDCDDQVLLKGGSYGIVLNTSKIEALLQFDAVIVKDICDNELMVQLSKEIEIKPNNEINIDKKEPSNTSKLETRSVVDDVWKQRWWKVYFHYLSCCNDRDAAEGASRAILTAKEEMDKFFKKLENKQ